MSEPNDHHSGRILYLTTVVPAYRLPFLDLLSEKLGDSFQVLCGDDYFGSIMTPPDVFDRPYVQRVQSWFLAGGRVCVQPAAVALIQETGTVVAESNPRCISTWVVLVARRLLRRRTFLWGHLRSRSGDRGWGRRLFQGLGSGVIFYMDAEAKAHDQVSKSRKAFVAPNGLVRRAAIKPAPAVPTSPSFVWSGRLIADKKPRLAIEAFQLLVAEGNSPNAQLVIVGDGPLRRDLEALVESLGLSEAISFLGAIYEPERLESVYEAACASISTGYVGLSLIQSLGFGRPMIAPRGEGHSPEIALSVVDGSVHWFESQDAHSLADAMRQAADAGHPGLAEQLQAPVLERHNIDAMVEGWLGALQ